MVKKLFILFHKRCRYVLTPVLLCVGMHCMNAAEDTLKVGMELTYPPFETINCDGEPAGISVEIARALALHLHKTLVIENIPFVGLLSALKAGKIDIIISSMTATEERAQSVDFSDPYLTTGLCLLVATDSPIQSINDIIAGNCTIVVKQGSTGQVYADSHLKQSVIRVLDKEASCVMEVVQKKADAFIYDQFSIYANWQKHSQTTRALLQPFSIEHWAIALPKNCPALKANINQFLKEFRQNGGFEQLANRYLHEQKAAFQRLGVPFYF